MTREDTITAAILGELAPELEYAAPVLLDRLNRSEPLVATNSPTDVGFETGSVDSVLLEFFKALVPYVKTMLGWGLLVIIQGWLAGQRESRQHAELVTRLSAVVEENTKLRQTMERVADLLARREGAPVSVSDVVELIAAATHRLGQTNDDDAPARV